MPTHQQAKQPSKKALASKLHGLYAITDEHLLTEDQFIEKVEAALQGGVRVLQYRDKSTDKNKRLQQTKQLRDCCTRHNVIFIINDDIDLCIASDADGVHLGKSDGAISLARNKLGTNAIIGASCYNDINLAHAAVKAGADYVAFGAIYASSTKPDVAVAGLDILKQARQQLSIPICAIGGINLTNAKQTIDSGANMLAVISSLFAENDINDTAKKFHHYF